MIPKRLNLLLSIYLWVACAAVLFAAGWFVPTKLLLGWLALGLVCYFLLLLLVPSFALGAPRAPGELPPPKEKRGPKYSPDIFSTIVMGLLPAIVISPFILIACSIARLVKKKEPIQEGSVERSRHRTIDEQAPR